MEVIGCSTGAIWCATQGLGFVVYRLAVVCLSLLVNTIVIRSYGTPVVLAVAHYFVGVVRCVSFSMRPLLDTDSVSSSGHIQNETHLSTPTQ